MGISEATFYSWKKKYGGLGLSELRRLWQLEEENRKLKQLVADLSLDKEKQWSELGYRDRLDPCIAQSCAMFFRLTLAFLPVQAITLPLFLYTITTGGQRKLVELRKSNPQGWLLRAVGEAFPEVASRLAGVIMRTRLEPIQCAKQSWKTTVPDGAIDLSILVIQKKP